MMMTLLPSWRPEPAERVGELALAGSELRHPARHSGACLGSRWTGQDSSMNMSPSLQHTGPGAERVQLRDGRSTGKHCAETLKSV